MAGMVAATAAAQEGADVVLADRGLIGRESVSVTAKQAAGVGPWSPAGYSAGLHSEDTLRAGRHVHRPELVRRLTRDAAEAWLYMEDLGLVLERDAALIFSWAVSRSMQNAPPVFPVCSLPESALGECREPIDCPTMLCWYGGIWKTGGNQCSEARRTA